MKKWIKTFTFAYGQGPPYSQPDHRMSVLGGRQNLLSGFFPLREYQKPTPTPLTENHSAQKPLAEMGGNPPFPPNPLTEKIR